MRRTAMVLGLLLLGGAAAQAQTLRYLKRTGGYGTIGFGGGNFKLSCDSGCAGNQLSAAGVSLMLGRHVSQRLRIDLGFSYQSNRDSASNTFGASLGAAVYLVGGLHVRGAATYQRFSVEEGTGTYEGSGGPGLQGGAGFDWYLGRRFIVTPYVTYTTASISRIERTQQAGWTSGGSLRALNFGVSIGRSVGVFECTNTAGTPIRLSRRTVAPFAGCLREMEARYGMQSTRGIKR